MKPLIHSRLLHGTASNSNPQRLEDLKKTKLQVQINRTRADGKNPKAISFHYPEKNYYKQHSQTISHFAPRPCWPSLLQKVCGVTNKLCSQKIRGLCLNWQQCSMHFSNPRVHFINDTFYKMNLEWKRKTLVFQMPVNCMAADKLIKMQYSGSTDA